MKKIAIFLVLIFVLNLSVMKVYGMEAPDLNDFVQIHDYGEGTRESVSISGDEYIFYKEGNAYVVEFEDGSTSIWAFDVLISSQEESSISTFASSNWI